MPKKLFNLQFSLMLVSFVFFLTFAGRAQQDDLQRGAGARLRYRQNNQEREVKMYDASYALVIGNSKYQSWQPLPGPRNDVGEVKTVLEENNFKVETEYDLTSETLEARFKKFISDYGFEPNNRLLIYFAGHGATLRSSDGREFGYIVPIDAPQIRPETEIEFKRKATSMERIESLAKEIQTKHVLFVFDSCFSGTLLSRSEVVPSVIGEYLSRPVRQFITSGSASQQVPDNSELSPMVRQRLARRSGLDQGRLHYGNRAG